MSPVPQFIVGDCREILKKFPDNHFHACVTDPPYGLEFMGKEWDRLQGDFGKIEAKNMTLPSITGSRRNVKCPDCGKWGYDHPGRHCRCGGILRYKMHEMQAWYYDWAVEVFRVMRPGGHIFSFGGDRTFHRLACAIEDAGFEIRRSFLFAWAYGSGFPKSMDLSKAIDRAKGVERKVVGKMLVDTGMQGGNMHSDRERKVEEVPMTVATSPEAQEWEGWGTDVKPAWEPIILARKPLSEATVAENVLKWGTGGINIDATRIGYKSLNDFDSLNENRKSIRTVRAGPVAEGYGMKPEGLAATEQSPLGRWPANFVLCHSEQCVPKGTRKVRSGTAGPDSTSGKSMFGIGDVHNSRGFADENGEEEIEDWECVEMCPVRLLDEQAGTTRSAPHAHQHQNDTLVYGGGKGLGKESASGFSQYEDEGGPSRFFYTAKAGGDERAFYCTICKAAFLLDAERDHKHGRPNRDHLVYHVTVKPLSVMRWLLAMVCKPGMLVLDPFVGSGTTCVAARALGVESTGMDLSVEYIAIARRRCGMDATGPLDKFAKVSRGVRLD